jgi:hypothetical protein
MIRCGGGFTTDLATLDRPCGKISKTLDRACGKIGKRSIAFYQKPGFSNRSVYPQVRRGFKSPSHSKSRLKPTEKDTNIIVKIIIKKCVF